MFLTWVPGQAERAMADRGSRNRTNGEGGSGGTSLNGDGGPILSATPVGDARAVGKRLARTKFISLPASLQDRREGRRGGSAEVSFPRIFNQKKK